MARSLLTLLALSLSTCTRGIRPEELKTAEPPRPAPPQGWISFMPQSTYFCVRLPDGSFRHAAYGVGGNTYVLQEGVQVAHAERDALCTNYGLTVLDAEGNVGSAAGYHSKGEYTKERSEPEAASLGVLGLERCVVYRSGELGCPGPKEHEAARAAQVLMAQGTIAKLLRGAPCALYRDGRVGCFGGDPTPYRPLFDDARDASIIDLRWGRFVGCALLRSGRVACLGSTALTLQGFTATAASQTPVVVPGLTDIDEVAVGGNTACARRGPRVFCWGETARREAGSAGFHDSARMPQCEVDKERTAAARAAFQAAVDLCNDPKRNARADGTRGDDPLCRSLWNATPPGTVFKPSSTPCDLDANGSSRWVHPTLVEEVDDALAIGSNGFLSCALRPRRTLTCWGGNRVDAQTITFPEAPSAHSP